MRHGMVQQALISTSTYTAVCNLTMWFSVWWRVSYVDATASPLFSEGHANFKRGLVGACSAAAEINESDDGFDDARDLFEHCIAAQAERSPHFSQVTAVPKMSIAAHLSSESGCIMSKMTQSGDILVLPNLGRA